MYGLILINNNNPASEVKGGVSDFWKPMLIFQITKRTTPLPQKSLAKGWVEFGFDQFRFRLSITILFDSNVIE